MKNASRLNPILSATVMMFLIAFGSNSIAQISTPPVQMNDISDSEPLMDGLQAVATNGANVYSVFTDTVLGGSPDLYLSRSLDGGETFEDDVLIFSNSNVTCVWGSIAVSDNGNIHVVWTAVTPLPEIGTTNTDLRGGGLDGDYNIWYSKSTDNGATFSIPIALTTNNASVFPAVGVYNDYVHVMYIDASGFPCADYYVVTSTDGGTSFGSAVQVNDGACNATINFEGLNNMTIAPDGTIHTVWVDARRLSGNGDIFTARSTDNGQTFGTNVMVQNETSPIIDAPQFYPSIAADGEDNVYISFTDQSLGNDFEDHRVYLSVSIDGGDSFAQEDFLAGFENEVCKYHKIAISGSGELVAALLSPAGLLEFGVRYLVSQNGGSTFSTAIDISDVADFNGSDLSITCAENGTTHLVWADDRLEQDQLNLFHSKTDHITSSTGKENSSEFSVFPNPAHDAVLVTLEKVQTVADLTVADSQGRVVHRNSLQNVDRTTVDLNLPAGFYTITVVTPDNLFSTKLLVVE